MSKETIIAAARQLFAARGYDGSSMDDIARAVGIRKPSLYAHYPGKDAIFLAVFESVLSAYAAKVEAVFDGVEGPDFARRLELIAVRYVAAYFDPELNGFWLRLYLGPPACLAGQEERMFDPDLRVAAGVADLFSEAAAVGWTDTPEGGAAAYVALLSGLAVNAAFGLSPADETSVTHAVQVLCRGLARRN